MADDRHDQVPDDDRTHLAVLEAVVGSMPDAAFGIDVDGSVISWNRSAEHIFGWSRDETIGHPIHRLFRVADAPTIDSFLTAVGNGDEVDRYEIDVDRKGGVQIPIALSLHPAIDRATDRVVALAAVAHDITERRIAQATMSDLEARVQEGESSAHMGRWLWDTASGTVQWSIEAHRIHGVQPIDFGGDLDAMLAFVTPEDRSRVGAAMQKSVDERRPFDEDYVIVRPDRTTCHVHSRAEPAVGGNGEVVGLRGVLTEF